MYGIPYMERQGTIAYSIGVGKHCIAKQDHHCVRIPLINLLPGETERLIRLQIWINNCVGHNNTRHFLAFLMATNIFLAYGAYLTRSIMNTHISKTYLKGRPVSILPWGPYFNLWGVILTMAGRYSEFS